MNTKLAIDKAGRVVLPKSIRDSLRIGPGDELEVESEGDRIILSPIRIRPGLRRERGIWVYRSGVQTDTSIPDLIDQQRDHRTREIIEGGR